jgi:hypothetical protein
VPAVLVAVRTAPEAVPAVQIGTLTATASNTDSSPEEMAKRITCVHVVLSTPGAGVGSTHDIPAPRPPDLGRAGRPARNWAAASAGATRWAVAEARGAGGLSGGNSRGVNDDTIAPVENVIVGAIVPLASVLLGAGLTYWLNVRSRQRTYVEDLFNQAIAAVAVAEASQNYVRHIGQPEQLSEHDHQEMVREITKAAVENAARKAAEAREALARVLEFEPRVRPYYLDVSAAVQRADEVIAVLTEGRERRARQGRRRGGRPAVS